MRKVILGAVLIGSVLMVMMYAESHYRYIYVMKEWGDGIKYLFRMTYWNMDRNYGIYGLVPFTWMGLSLIQALNTYYYLLIGLSLGGLYLLTSKVHYLAGIIAVIWIGLADYSFFMFIHNATILGMASIFIFQFSLVYVMSLYLPTRDIKYLSLACVIVALNFLFYQAGGVVSLIYLILACLYSRIRGLNSYYPLYTALGLLGVVYLIAYVATSGLDHKRVLWHLALIGSVLSIMLISHFFKYVQLRLAVPVMIALSLFTAAHIYGRWTANKYEDITYMYRNQDAIAATTLNGSNDIIVSGRYLVVSKVDAFNNRPTINEGTTIVKIAENKLFVFYEIVNK